MENAEEIATICPFRIGGICHKTGCELWIEWTNSYESGGACSFRRIAEAVMSAENRSK